MKAALYRFACWLDGQMHQRLERGRHPLANWLHGLAHELAYAVRPR